MGREEKGEGNVDSIAMGRRRNKNKKLAVRKAPYNDRCHSHPLYGKLNRVMDKLGEDDGDDEEGEDELVRELSALLEEAPLPHRTAASHAGTSMEEVRNALETVRGRSVLNEKYHIYTPIQLAIACNNVAVLEVLVEMGADPNWPKGEAHPLRKAVWYARPDCISALAKAGANLTDTIDDDDFRSVLHLACDMIACKKGHPSAVRTFEALMSARPGRGILNHRDYDEETALHAVLRRLTPACGCCDAKEGVPTEHRLAAEGAVRAMLDAGAELDRDGAMNQVAGTKDGGDLVDLLVRHGARIDSRRDGKTPLHDAATSDAFVGTLRALLRHGADPNALSSNYFHAPLHFSVYSKLFSEPAIECMEALVEAGADVDARSKGSEVTTPLQRALSWIRDSSMALKAVSTLLRLGARADDSDDIPKERTPLALALGRVSEGGWEDVVSLLLSHGADVNNSCPYPGPLHMVGVTNNLAVEGLLLKAGAKVDSRDLKGDTLLHVAASLSFLKLMRLLVDYGADMDAKNGGGFTPLDLALPQSGAAAGLREDLRLYLRGKAPMSPALESALVRKEMLNKRHPSMGETPLQVACKVGDEETARMLLRHGSDVNARSVRGARPIDHVLRLSRSKECVQLLVGDDRFQLGDVDVAEVEGLLGAPLRLPHQKYYSYSYAAGPGGEDDVAEFDSSLADVALDSDEVYPVDGVDVDIIPDPAAVHEAVERNNIEELLELLEVLTGGGAEVHVRDGRGQFPLNVAAGKVNSLEVMDELLSRGAEVNCRGVAGRTPLFAAAAAGRLENVEYLVGKGADAKLGEDSSGLTPLHLAAQEDGKLMLEVLIGPAAGEADPDVCSRHGATPLHFAAMADAAEAAKVLLNRKKASAKVKCKRGNTPLHVAAGARSHRVARLLLERGAPVKVKNSAEETPVFLAASNGDCEMLELLLSKNSKAVRDVQDRHGKTPLYSAVENRHFDAAMLLLDNRADPNLRERHSGETAMHLSAALGDRDLVKRMMEAGGDVNARDRGGCSPVHRVALTDDMEMFYAFTHSRSDVLTRPEEWSNFFMMLGEHRSANLYSVFARALEQSDRSMPLEPRHFQHQ